MQQVTVFKNIRNVTEPHYMDVLAVLNLIKNGKVKNTIEKIRTFPEKKLRDEQKATLPSICFSGIFERRANDKIKQHSGLVCLDFDHVQNVDDLKAEICADKYTFAAFTSPSGDGVKVIVKIPASIENHAKHCKALKNYFAGRPLDSFEDVARVCYMSYDPEIYVNTESEIFTKLPVEAGSNTTNKDIFDLLKVWIEKHDSYYDNNKYKFLVKFAGALNRFGVGFNEAAARLSAEYANAAQFVPYEDFVRIVKSVYTRYAGQHNTAMFTESKRAVHKGQNTELNSDFFTEYQSEEKEPGNGPHQTGKAKETPEQFSSRMKIIMEERYVNPAIKVEPPKPILSIGNEYSDYSRCFTSGNISCLGGRYKSKKTYLQSMFMASIASNKEIFEGIRPNLNPKKGGVIGFDTEQSKWDVYNVTHRVIKLAGYEPENFGMFSLKGMPALEIIEFINYIVTDKYKGALDIIFIDQVADLVKSVNKEEEAVDVVKFLEALNNTQDIHINTVLHQNKHDSMVQGWLGTQIMKKSETVLSIEKDSNDFRISHVYPEYTRGPEFDSFSIFIREGTPEIVKGSKPLKKS